MAIATTWLTVATNITTSAALYTVNTSGVYERDLVITNSGLKIGYVSVGASVSSAAATAGFVLPAGGSAILTQCAIPANTIIYGYAASATNFSIGYASNVTYE